MTKEERIEMIIEYARKVVMYPKGSKGYDPADLMSLEYAIEKYDKELIKENEEYQSTMTTNSHLLKELNDKIDEVFRKIVYTTPSDFKITHDGNCTHGLFVGKFPFEDNERLKIQSPSFTFNQEDDIN